MTKIKCWIYLLTRGSFRWFYNRNYDKVAAVEWLKLVDTLRKRLKDKWGAPDSEESVMHFDIQEIELFTGWNDEKFGEGKG